MKKGFTLVELMMVMVVMALIATLATGAAMKSIRQGKEQRINATRVALEMAVTTYRAEEQTWPLALEPKSGESTVEFRDTNGRVFGPLIENPKKCYVDPSSLLTKVAGFGVISLREAIERKLSPESCSIGYPDPEKSNTFTFYKVTFNLATDTVKVDR